MKGTVCVNLVFLGFCSSDPAGGLNNTEIVTTLLQYMYKYLMYSR